MRLKKLPPECIAPFRLKEITLHGIGSYYKPACLEIKPLTILCGTNGSGKSTWMKVLSTMKEALAVVKDKKEKPGELDFLVRLCIAFNETHLLNENLNYQEIFTSINDDEWDSYVGPKGSFSLSYTCTRATELNTEAVKSSAKWPSVLRTQTLQKGDVIRFRFTQCAIRQQQSPNIYYLPAARLSINGKFIEVCVGQKKINDDAVCSFRTGTESRDEQSPDDITCRKIKEDDALLDAFSKFAEKILHVSMLGYFKISAIRPIHEEVKDCIHVASTRYVGKNGEYAHSFREYFSMIEVLDPRAKYSYSGIDRSEDEDFFKEWEKGVSDYRKRSNSVKLSDTWLNPENGYSDRYDETMDFFKTPALCRWLYDNHYDKIAAFRDRIEQLKKFRKIDHKVEEKNSISSEISEIVAKFAGRRQKTTGKVGSKYTSRYFTRITSKTLSTVSEFLKTGQGCLLNSDQEWSLEVKWFSNELSELLLKELFMAENFFRWVSQKLCDGSMEVKHPYYEKGKLNCEWLNFLADIPDENLSVADRRALNMWALAMFTYVSPFWAFCNSMMFDWWAKELLKMQAKDGADMGMCDPLYLMRNRELPVGYLSSYKGFKIRDRSELPYYNRMLAGGVAECGDYSDDNWAYRPGDFSAGLHQVVPILVQMNMMKMNEVLAVENPEVHLHPGLQLKFMGFFIENALIGKYSLIETHSDLMIRRVMRAIHEEKLPQSWVNVVFVDEEQVEGEDIWTAKIDRLWLNEQGAISNWPKGFLDDDVLESEALMRAMYGSRASGEEESSHE